MPAYGIIPMEGAHALQLAANMRSADVAEVWASTHLSPAEALSRAMRYTKRPMVGVADDTVLCGFGVGSRSPFSVVGVPWMLSAHAIEDHAVAFLRGSIGVVESWRRAFPVLENYVDARNTLAIRWLRWLGFVLDAPKPYGPDGKLFHRFAIGEV